METSTKVPYCHTCKRFLKVYELENTELGIFEEKQCKKCKTRAIERDLADILNGEIKEGWDDD